ncbi:MAG: hypothetical protein AB8F74_16650 [Saprospiraceae bacterium]
MVKKSNTVLKRKNGFDKTLWQNAAFFLIITFAFSVVYYLAFKKHLDLNGDNASYFLLGKSLSLGEGYSLYNNPDAKPHNHFPPGYPFILATLMLISKEVLWLKIANGVFFLGASILSFQLFRKFEVKWQVALVSIIFMLTNYHLLKSATIIMSEIPYLLLVTVTLWLLLKIDFSKDFWNDVNFYYCLLALSFAFHIRTIGVSLFAGIIFYLLIEKKWKGVTAVSSGFVVLALPWIIRGKVLGLGTSYQKQLLAKNPYQLELGVAGPIDIIERFGENIIRYISKEIPISIFSFREVNYRIPSEFPDYAIGILLITLIILGIYLLPRYRSLILGYLSGSFFILLLWPKVWTGARFILPLIPILILLIVFSCNWILEKTLSFTKFRSNYLSFLLLPLIIFSLQKHNPNKDAKFQSYSLNRLFLEAKIDYPIKWRNYFELGIYAKNHLPNDAYIACRKPQLLHIKSNRHTTNYPYLEDDKELI